MEIFFLIVFIILIVGVFYLSSGSKGPSLKDREAAREELERMRQAKSSPEALAAERKNPLSRAEVERLREAERRMEHLALNGEIVPKMVCPHCHEKGQVRKSARTRVIESRVNSLPARAIGLGTNTKKEVTALFCGHCNMKWDI